MASWKEFAVQKGQKVELHFDNLKIEVPFVETFGEVKENEPLILQDDYVRVEVAMNMENFAEKYNIKIGDSCIIQK